MNYLEHMCDSSIPWHNPDKLTPGQVDPEGEGWRLMLREEIKWTCPSRTGIEGWLSNEGGWHRPYHGNCVSITYRVKWPLPEKCQQKTPMNKTKYVNTEGQPELQDMLYKLARSLGLEATNYKHEGAISFDSRRNLIDCSALRFREGNGDEEISVQEFITLLKSAARKEESVRLNDQYTAIVSKDGVKAGCQSFPLSVIDDLAKAKERVLA